MNNWNPVEYQLRSWKPRGPSPALKGRLFPKQELSLAESPSPFGARWGWLAPVMGCFLAVMAVSSSRSTQFGAWPATTTTDWMAAAASNQSYAAYIAGSLHSEQNALQVQPIEWTNGPRARQQQPASSAPFATNRSLSR